MIFPAAICVFIVASIYIFPFKAILNPPAVSNIWKDSSVLDSLNYVEVTMDELHYTGYDTTTLFNKQFSYYYSLKNGQCFLFLIPTPDHIEETITDYTFRGAVVSKNTTLSYNQLVQDLSNDIQWNSASLDKVISPYIISNAGYHPYICLAVMAILFFIFAYELFQFVLHLTRYIKPNAYPLCPHARISNKSAFINDIHKQVEEHLITQQEDLYLTPKFLIEYNNKRVVTIPLSTVAWSYRMGTLNYRISHHNPKYNLYMVLLTGESIVFENKNSESCSSILEELRLMNKDIILGYTDAKRKAAKKLTKEYNKQKFSK